MKKNKIEITTTFICEIVEFVCIIVFQVSSKRDFLYDINGKINFGEI